MCGNVYSNCIKGMTRLIKNHKLVRLLYLAAGVRFREASLRFLCRHLVGLSIPTLSRQSLARSGHSLFLILKLAIYTYSQ